MAAIFWCKVGVVGEVSYVFIRFVMAQGASLVSCWGRSGVCSCSGAFLRAISDDLCSRRCVTVKDLQSHSHCREHVGHAITWPGSAVQRHFYAGPRRCGQCRQPKVATDHPVPREGSFNHRKLQPSNWEERKSGRSYRDRRQEGEEYLCAFNGVEPSERRERLL